MLYVLDTRHFLTTFAPIVVPKDCVMTRNGMDSALSDRPAAYVSAGHGAAPYIFKTTRPLRLLDFRSVCSMLGYVFAHHNSSMYNTLALAYGLCSLRKQLDLYKTQYKLVMNESRVKARFATLKKLLDGKQETPGVRIADPEIDAQNIVYLGHIFQPTGIDGCIFPNIRVPYETHHPDNVIPTEIVLFNPAASLVATGAPERVRRFTIETLAHSTHADAPMAFTVSKQQQHYHLKESMDAGSVLARMSPDEYTSMCRSARLAVDALSSVVNWKV